MIDWDTVFDTTSRVPGATDAEVAEFLATVGRPLSPAEVAAENRRQQNPFPATDPLHAIWRPFDPSRWRFPAGPIPESYLSFVRWSNGGQFTTGKRHFGMWGTGLRGMAITYGTPQFMPGTLPFAMNGGGVMYLFDMREPPVAGEYPILVAHAGNQGFGPDEATRVADSFPEVCRERFNVERLLHGGVVLTAPTWPACTDPKPMLDEVEDLDDAPRKLRLFAVACCRRIWEQIPKEFRDAVALAEKLADGGLTQRRRANAKQRCEAAEWTPATSAATSCLSSDPGSAAWNGAWAAAVAEAGTHEGPAWVAARSRQADLIREIAGDPFRPVDLDPAWLAWNDGTVPRIAARIYAENCFGDLPVLADALQDAGCEHAALLTHLRGPGPHVRGCWALDLLRPRE